MAYTGQRCLALKYARGFYNLFPGLRNLKSTVYKLQFDALLGTIQRIFFKLLAPEYQ